MYRGRTVPTRLDKYLRDATHLPLASLRLACGTGRVRVHVASADQREILDGATRLEVSDDTTRLEADSLVFEGDSVEFDGKVVEPRQPMQHYIAFNKPLGVTSTVSDPDGFRDLSDWLNAMPAGVFPVGRLDRMTSGLLLFTSDGDFSHALLHPYHHVSKRYQLVVAASLEAADPRLLALREGIRIAGTPEIVRADEVHVVSRSRTRTKLVIQLHQGKHRQIRKMCHAVGLSLNELERVSIGTVELGGLSPGAHRSLLAEEVACLWECAGGRSTVIERQIRALRNRARRGRAEGRPLLRLEQWLRQHAAL